MVKLHSCRVRVYWEDTDGGGIVYYANYLRFFERARTEWLRSLDVSQQSLAEREGILFVIRECAIQYLHPARLDDELEVTVAVEAIDRDLRRASMRIVQRASRVVDNTVLATGRVRVACITRADGRPTPIPDWLLERMRGGRTGPGDAAKTDPAIPTTPAMPTGTGRLP